MCHEWSRREREREELIDEELQHLIDEERERAEPTPVVERESDEAPAKPERVEV